MENLLKGLCILSTMVLKLVEGNAWLDSPPPCLFGFVLDEKIELKVQLSIFIKYKDEAFISFVFSL